MTGTPGTASMDRDGLRATVLGRVRAEGVRLVGLLYCDNANVVRGKAAYAGALGDCLESGSGHSAGRRGLTSA
jgi:hypothetical protein